MRVWVSEGLMEGKGEEDVALGEKKKFDVVDRRVGVFGFDYRETASQKQVQSRGGVGRSD